MYDTGVMHVLLQRCQKPITFESFGDFQLVAPSSSQSEDVLSTALELQAVMQQGP